MTFAPVTPVSHLSRRDFVHTTAAATAAIAFPVPLTRQRVPDPIRVGLVGCGGRGTGAAADCLHASEGVEIVAMGDLFSDRIAAARAELTKLATEDPRIAAGFRVTDDRTFTGFDAYRKVIAADIDLVILATPPGFRPGHLAAAIAAGRHVFMEKPVAVDPTGVRSVIATCEIARQQSLAVVAGTQRRHHAGYRAVIARVRGGAIGDVISGQVYWNQGGLWHKPRVAEWSDTEWQLRNWLYFTWLSGDHIVEQHIHNLDVANWVMDAHPVRAVGVGGRQWRTDVAFGHVYDHFAIEFEYPGGRRLLSMCRQIDGTAPFVGERFQGTRGATDARSTIEGPNAWTAADQVPNPYVQEHADLLASIRAGSPLNEGRQVAESTLTAIMGREAAYTGQVVEWDALLAAEQHLMPPDVGFGPLPVPPVAMPGHTAVARVWNEA
jgi:predicted dehydrogenase